MQFCPDALILYIMPEFYGLFLISCTCYISCFLYFNNLQINKLENIYENGFEKWQRTLNFHVDYAKAKLFSYTRVISFGVNFVLNMHTFIVIISYKFIRSLYHLKPFMCISVYVYHIKFLNKMLEEIKRF